MTPIKEDSNIEVCRNLRAETYKRLGRVATPTQLSTIGRKPVYCDTMNAKQYIFTQEDDGTIYVNNIEIGRIASSIEEGAAVGDFIIFRLKNNTLLYLSRHPDANKYRWLGTLPPLPAFSLTIHNGTSLSVPVSAVKFGTSIATPVNPVSADTSSRLWNAWQEAFVTLQERIHAAGLWCEDVEVCIAMRLWDGTRLHVSEPVRLTFPNKPGRTRFTANLTYDAAKKMYTGVEESTLTSTGFNIELHILEGIPDRWADFIDGFEVWVTREVDPVKHDIVPSTSFSVMQTSAAVISFVPAMRQEADVTADIENMPFGCVNVCPIHTGTHVVNFDSDTKFDDKVRESLTPMPGASADAACILGHGEFLHTGSGDDLYTSQRGNPLILKCVTRGVGTSIRSLRAQHTGGGAFTRQYIYVSTDRGIVAVTHKSDGTHTNARLISSEPLTLTETWLSTPRGVYAVGSTRSLLLIKDAKVTTQIQHLEGVKQLLWSSAYAELWLARDDDSIVWQQRYKSIYVRDDTFMPIAGAVTPALTYRSSNDGYYYIHSLDEESMITRDVDYQFTLPIMSEAWQQHIEFAMCTDGTIDFYIRTPEGRRLMSGHYDSPRTAGLRALLYLPHIGNTLYPGLSELSVTLRGKVLTLTDISLTPKKKRDVH
ncbi:MAG: hypothetical protein NC217_06890 [Muribaculaceae bacterium]|nr:hypothetical protein [Muribaculaceae bacterium]